MKFGNIISIFTAAKAGVHMEMSDSAVLRSGYGIVGDRYGEGVGSFSTKEPIKTRHLTIISSDAFIRANKDFAIDERFVPSDTRRNIIASIGVDSLNSLVGKIFRIGKVHVFGTELCTPCNLISTLAQKPDFKGRFAGMGGIRVEVLDDGPIQVGEEIRR